MRMRRPSTLFNTDLRHLPAAASPTYGPSYWVYGDIFTVAYVLLERASVLFQLDGLSITLWNPSAGASLIFLLFAGVHFAPFVGLASLLTDFATDAGAPGLLASLGTSLVLGILAIVPAGILLLALCYCLVLYLTGILSFERFFVALRNFWIGETLGIVSLLPAAIAVSQAIAEHRSPSRAEFIDAAIFTALLAAALWIIFGLRRAHEYQLFYLLFIPVVWIAVRTGYAGVSLALPVVHALIVTIATVLGRTAYDLIAFQM